MKKILSLILAFMLLIPGTFANADNDEEIYRFLESIDIVEKESDNDFYMNDKITRGESAHIIAKLADYNLSSQKEDKIYFYDVNSSNIYFNEINYLLKMDIISDSKYYRPDDYVTVNEFTTMILNLLGYKPIAIEKGGYPGGYISLGNSLSLYKGVDLKNKEVTRKMAANFIYNAFDINVMEVDKVNSVTGEVTYKKSDDTLLNKKHIYKIKGIVTATNVTNLYYSGEVTGDNQIKIGNEIYNCENNYNDLIGMNVEAFYYDFKDKEKEIVYIYETNNEKKELNFKDIADFNLEGNDKYIREEKGNDYLKIKIAENPIVIHNGKAVKESNLLIDKNKLGKVTLLNNKDKTYKGSDYNVIIIESYSDFVVSSVIENKLYFKQPNFSGINYLDLKDTSLVITDNGKRIEAKDLKEDDIVSVLKSYDNKYLKIYVSHKIVTGNVKEIMKDDKASKVIIEKEEYELSKEAIHHGNFSVGENVKAYINFKNQIIYTANSNVKNYGIILGYNKKNEFSPLYIKLVNTNGEIKKYKADEKEDLIPVLTSIRNEDEQIIIYELNNKDEIKNIIKASSPSGNLYDDQNKFILDTVVKEDVIASQVSLGEKVFIDNPVIFTVPKKVSGVYDEEKIEVKSGNLSLGNTYNNIYAYDKGLNGCAKAIMIVGDAKKEFKDLSRTNMLVVDKTVKVYDNIRGEVTKIYGMFAKEPIEIKVDPEAIKIIKYEDFKEDISDIGQGDILIYETDNKGYINKYLVANKAYKDNKYGKIFCQGGGYLNAQELEFYKGKVGYYDDKVIPVMTNDNKFINCLRKDIVNTVTIVDKNKKKVYNAPFSELIKASSDLKNLGDEIFVLARWGSAQHIVCYKY